MFARWLAAAVLAVTFSVAAAAAQHKDPDAPATQAAAREALKNARVLGIEGKTVEIVGISRGVEGTVLDLKGALRDLGAKVTDQEIRIELSADVLFDFDKAGLRPEAVPSLQKVAAVINGYPNVPVRIEGHTDAKGADAYNMTLSESRAASVRSWLVRNGGVDGGRITAYGRGETKPVAPNTKRDGSDDPEGRQKNRRVEITLKKG